MHSALDFFLLTETSHSAHTLTFSFIFIKGNPFGEVTIIVCVSKDALRLFSVFTELMQEQSTSLSAVKSKNLIRNELLESHSWLLCSIKCLW